MSYKDRLIMDGGERVMATCKECLHVETCKAIVTIINEATELQIDDDIETTIDADLTCEYFADRSRFVELPCKVGDVLYGIVPWGNGYKIVFVYVEEIILALRRDKNRVAEKGVFDIKIRPKRRKPIDLKDIFFTVEQAEQALKERERK